MIFLWSHGECTLGADVDSEKNRTKTNFRKKEKSRKGRWSPPLTEIGSAHEFSNETPCENEPLDSSRMKMNDAPFSCQRSHRFCHLKQTSFVFSFYTIRVKPRIFNTNSITSLLNSLSETFTD